MNKKPAQAWENIMVRLLPDDMEKLRHAAFAARHSVSVFARELVLGRVPKVAPPLVAELTFQAQELLKIIHGTASNLSQINAHAQAAGEPLSRLSLSGPAGLIFKLHSKVREIGLQLKSGQLDSDKTSELLTRLKAPARALNDELALPLNEGSQPEMGVWKGVLDDLQNALLEGEE